MTEVIGTEDERNLLELADLAKVQPQEALQKLAEIIEKPGHDSRYSLLRGSVLIQMGRPDEAVKDMRVAVSESPRSPVARFQLGMLLLTQGRVEEARDAWAQLSEEIGSALFFFKEGLLALCQDDWAGFRNAFSRGMVSSGPYPAIAANMKLISDAVDEVAPHGSESHKIDPLTLLLSGYLESGTRH